jgi:cell division protein FtsI (penicillin-binding protein 3)
MRNSSEKEVIEIVYTNNTNSSSELTKQYFASSKRIELIFVFFLILFLLIFSRLVYLAIYQTDEINFERNLNKQDYIIRKDIVDKNNIVIAKNIDVYDLVLNTSKKETIQELLVKVKKIIPEVDIVNLLKESESKKKIIIKKKIDENEFKKIIFLGEPSLEFQKRQVRIYPQRNLFSHIMGQVDDDNIGISGIENYFNESLLKKNTEASFQITIDIYLQTLMRNELLEAIKDYNAKGAAGVLMRVDNGEVLALNSLPDFDLNKRVNISDEKYLNKITLGLYELGSVFKSFIIANAIDLKKIDENTLFYDLEKKIMCGGHDINEHEKNLKSDLTTTEILVKSSNIGAVKIADLVGIENYKTFLQSIGLLNKSTIQLPEKGHPFSAKWDKCTLYTASFGHGVSTTPLQLAAAYGTLVNGGSKIHPTIIKNNSSKKITKEQVITNETSQKMIKMLRKVVIEGTATKANIDGYNVVGKTGTALKVSKNSKEYGKDKINVFVSAFPEEKPEYVLLVMLDEPKSAPQLGHYRTESGWNAVPVSGKLVKKLGPILALNKVQVAANAK